MFLKLLQKWAKQSTALPWLDTICTHTHIISNGKSKRILFFEVIKRHFITLFFSFVSPLPNFNLSSSNNASDLKWILLFHFFFLYPDILVFHLCAVNPQAALSSSGVTLNWTSRQGIKTLLWLNRSVSKPLQLTEIPSSATIIFNEASLLLESWQRTVIYSSPRAMTANWANIKITCNVKSACAYHYTKTPWCAGKEACQAIVFVNEKNSFTPSQSTVSDLIEQVLTKHRA